MSRALSVYHGRFGRATLYELNRPMTTHAHREGHLIFYVGRGHAAVPGMISCRLLIIWQPLQTPSANVSAR